VSEQKTIPVVERDPATDLDKDKLYLSRTEGANRVHLMYKWMDGDIEKILHISINSPVIVVDDLNADLSLWNGEAREQSKQWLASAEKALHEAIARTTISPIDQNKEKT